MIAFLVQVIRVSLILTFVVLVASTIASIALFFAFGLPLLSALPDPLSDTLRILPKGLVVIPLLILGLVSLISLLFALSPIILLLAIYDAVVTIKQKNAPDKEVLLTAKGNQKSAHKTEPMASR